MRLLPDVWITHEAKTAPFCIYGEPREKKISDQFSRYIPGPENTDHWAAISADLAERGAGVEVVAGADKGLRGIVQFTGSGEIGCKQKDEIFMRATPKDGFAYDGPFLHAALVKELP